MSDSDKENCSTLLRQGRSLLRTVKVVQTAVVNLAGCRHRSYNMQSGANLAQADSREGQLLPNMQSWEVLLCGCRPWCDPCEACLLHNQPCTRIWYHVAGVLTTATCNKAQMRVTRRGRMCLGAASLERALILSSCGAAEMWQAHQRHGRPPRHR